MHPRTILTLLPALLLTVLTAACVGKSPQAVYYTLSSIEEAGPVQADSSPGKLAIGLGPVRFPDELDRPSIVTRSGRHQLLVNDFHRWGGSLKNNFSQVVVENLMLLLKTDQVMARPWEHFFRPTVRIMLDVRRFDGRLGEHAVLNATWVLVDEQENLPAITRRTAIREPVSADGYDAFVAAQSRAIARLCREMAKALVETKHLPSTSTRGISP